MIRIGFHMSIAGSVANAPISAALHGYTAFQMFTESSRRWIGRGINAVGASAFRETVKAADLLPYAHIPYLSNPSSPNAEVHSKSVGMIVRNMENCSMLGVGYLVLHIGSHIGAGAKVGVANVCDALGKVLDSSGKVRILLENSAGYRNSVGSRFEEIGEVIDRVGSGRIGLCLDTCHTFAAGYDLGSAEGIERTVSELDRTIGLRRLKLVHLNDSRFGLGSGLDRHWHIGKGRIGMRGFVELFRNRAFRSGSFIMETPVNGEGDNASNLRAAVEAISTAGASLYRQRSGVIQEDSVGRNHRD